MKYVAIVLLMILSSCSKDDTIECYDIVEQRINKAGEYQLVHWIVTPGEGRRPLYFTVDEKTYNMNLKEYCQ